MVGLRCRSDAIASFPGATQANTAQWLLGYAGTVGPAVTKGDAEKFLAALLRQEIGQVMGMKGLDPSIQSYV